MDSDCCFYKRHKDNWYNITFYLNDSAAPLSAINVHNRTLKHLIKVLLIVLQYLGAFSRVDAILLGFLFTGDIVFIYKNAISTEAMKMFLQCLTPWEQKV